jgi:hypothetical protein
MARACSTCHFYYFVATCYVNPKFQILLAEKQLKIASGKPMRDCQGYKWQHLKIWIRKHFWRN